jgi:transcriptional regulator with XRE-family HTH domain
MSRKIGLGRAIVALRESVRLSSAKLAARSGLDTHSLEEIEQGSLDPEWGTVRRVAFALVATPTQLVEAAECFEGRTFPTFDRKTTKAGRRLPTKAGRRLPPPFTDQELAELTAWQRSVLASRYGLVDGLSHTFREIGEEYGFTASHARATERLALRRIKGRRSPATAFAAGARMAGDERAGAPLPGPYEQGGVARGRKAFGRATSRLAEQLVGEALRVVGDRWSLGRGEEPPLSRPTWTIFCEEGGRGRVAAARWEVGRLWGPVLLAVVPPTHDRQAVARWLERVAIQHQADPHSLAFVAGGLLGLLQGSAAFQTVDDLEQALLVGQVPIDLEGGPRPSFPIRRRLDQVSHVTFSIHTVPSICPRGPRPSKP